MDSDLEEVEVETETDVDVVDDICEASGVSQLDMTSQLDLINNSA